MSVYLAHNPADGLYKIGRTKYPKSRVHRLRQEYDAPGIRILSYAKCTDDSLLERIAHGCFKEQWVRGEWFMLSERLVTDFWDIVYLTALNRKRNDIEIIDVIDTNI